jgi:signal transduction histidine kinase
MAYAMRGYFGIPGMPYGLEPLPPWAWLLIVAATAAVLIAVWLLPRRPLLSLGLLLGATVASALAFDQPTLDYVQFVAVSVAAGHIAATRSRRTGLVALGVTLLQLPAYTAVCYLSGREVPRAVNGSFGGFWQVWQVLALVALVAWLIGNSVRQVREHNRRLQQQIAAQAVTAERLRIARELHDMVAHSIGIIALQSGAASRVIHTQPDAAREAMIAVETTSRETLSGLRHMLGALRQPEASQRLPAPLEPAPTLAEVDRLAAATTAAGVRVEVSWVGSRRPLPPEVELSAFRIVQESVTNVVRHAAASSCQVALGYTAGHLTIDVTDDGRGSPDGGATGYGLMGMRERVALLGGEFTAAPGPEGGFRVTARLPLPPLPAPLATPAAVSTSEFPPPVVVVTR